MDILNILGKLDVVLFTVKQLRPFEASLKPVYGFKFPECNFFFILPPSQGIGRK
jgi:hypothetical protein